MELALASSNAIEHMSLSYDPATRRLFGVPWWLPGLASITTTRPISCAPTRRDLRRHPQMPCGATLVRSSPWPGGVLGCDLGFVRHERGEEFCVGSAS